MKSNTMRRLLAGCLLALGLWAHGPDRAAAEDVVVRVPVGNNGLMAEVRFILPPPQGVRGRGPRLQTSEAMPELGDFPFSMETDHFAIWWQESGPNKIDYQTDDTDGDGYPQFINIMGDALEHAYETIVETDGFPQPYNMDFAAGDRIEVYFAALIEMGMLGVAYCLDYDANGKVTNYEFLLDIRLYLDDAAYPGGTKNYEEGKSRRNS